MPELRQQHGLQLKIHLGRLGNINLHKSVPVLRDGFFCLMLFSDYLNEPGILKTTEGLVAWWNKHFDFFIPAETTNKIQSRCWKKNNRPAIASIFISQYIRKRKRPCGFRAFFNVKGFIRSRLSQIDDISLSVLLTCTVLSVYHLR
jgi:hypothetical protein